jgi:hypothetical protein
MSEPDERLNEQPNEQPHKQHGDALDEAVTTTASGAAEDGEEAE